MAGERERTGGGEAAGGGALVRSAFYSTLSNLSSFLLLLLMVLAGRYLGDRDYGIFSFGLSFVFIFEIFTDFGLREITVRDVARDRERAPRYLGNILSWKFLLSVLTFGLIVFVIRAMHVEPGVRHVVYLLGASIVLRSFKSTGRMFFQAFERFDLDALTLFVERGLLLLAGGIVLLSGRGLTAFVLVFVAVRLIDLLVTSSILHFKLLRIRPRFDPGLIRRIQVEAIPVGVFLMALNLYSYIDTVMLSQLRGYAEVGWYSAAYKLYEGAVIFPAILCAVVAPRLSRYFVTDRASHRILTRRSVKYMFVVSLPIVGVGVLLSGRVIDLCFGADYAPSIPALRVLLIGLVFVFQSWFFNTLLISIDRQKSLLHAILIGLGINILLNIILIPRLGLLGAAVATVASEALIFLFYLVAIGLSCERIPFLRLGSRPLLAASIVIVLAGGLGFPDSVLIAAGLVAVYVVLLLLLRVFDDEERRLLLRFLRPRPGTESDQAALLR